MLNTRLTRLLGISAPILLGPMTPSSNATLTAAVTTAGGLGVLGGGFQTADWITNEFRATREKVSKDLGCSEKGLISNGVLSEKKSSNCTKKSDLDQSLKPRS